MWFFKLIRWPNLLILILLQVFSGLFLIETQLKEVESIFWQRLIWILISTALIAAGGNIINDIQDIEIDLINKPGKQIVGKYIPRNRALVFYGLLTFCGLLISSFVGFQYFVWTLNAAQALWFYSAFLKCQPLIGNIAVAFLMGLSVWVTQFAGENFDINLVLFYAVFAFLTGFIREIIKDIEDKKGDENCGCQTFAVIASLDQVKNTIYILLSLSLLVLIFSGLFFYYNGLIFLALYLIIIIGTAFIFYGIEVRKAKEKEQFSRLSFYIKIVILMGIVSMPLAKISL